MTKVKHAVASRKKRKKFLNAAKGNFGARSKLLRTVKEAVRKSLVSNYYDRKKKKGNFRALWITRIAAACKMEGLTYSKFMCGLKQAQIALNRKMLADIANNDNKGFKALVKKVKV